MRHLSKYKYYSLAKKSSKYLSTTYVSEMIRWLCPKFAMTLSSWGWVTTNVYNEISGNIHIHSTQSSTPQVKVLVADVGSPDIAV